MEAGGAHEEVFAHVVSVRGYTRSQPGLLDRRLSTGDAGLREKL